MREQLRTSPQYSDKIAKTRESSSREVAKLLRMEFLLDNAKCVRLLIQYIEQNPTASLEQFQEYATSTGLITQPEVIEDFINQLRFFIIV